ncbi:sugar ABC transporter substrate-binding protein [Amaricoccus solimangrovi]|uniref:Sugar ABC transporter substrate-binding protein n=1 Tax=Amaricoccus solimangrovi TaxID=2589815 RepID=A0A501W933_9RHOB|nr:sugar ABC transporter substrate-binding protein [Amaricoccus solimangrovi]TPE44564.1 sugar ABC transporter substrate-binding protein [Amaricoccus solimangrovi]
MKPMKILAAVLASTAVIAFCAPVGAHAEGSNIVVIGGKPDDPFWAKVKKGADDAGLVVTEHGGSVTWLGPQSYDNLGADAANLIRTALSQQPDAIIGPDWVPESMDDAFKAAISAGVPVVIYNAGGMEAAQRLGAMNFVGNDELIAGTAAGKYLGEHGAKNVICVNTVPGAANLEARCKGVSEGIAATGGTASQLPLPATSFGNPTAVAEAIKAALLKNAEVDGVITISASDANSAANGIMQAGGQGRVKLGSFDFDKSGLDRVKDGSQLFAVDQQPYMQGYLAVSLAAGYASYGLDIPTAPILTGPKIVDGDSVDAAIEGVAAGVR